MVEESGRGQSRLRSLEGRLQLRRPLEPLGRASQSNGERPEDGGGAWNETAVKVDKTEEPVKDLN